MTYTIQKQSSGYGRYYVVRFEELKARFQDLLHEWQALGQQTTAVAPTDVKADPDTGTPL